MIQLQNIKKLVVICVFGIHAYSKCMKHHNDIQVFRHACCCRPLVRSVVQQFTHVFKPFVFKRVHRKHQRRSLRLRPLGLRRASCGGPVPCTDLKAIHKSIGSAAPNFTVLTRFCCLYNILNKMLFLKSRMLEILTKFQ